MTELKELHLTIDGTDLETIAMNLINLERLWIGGAVDHLKIFLRYSKTLKMVIFDDCNNPGDALNLFTLNQERKMAGSQRKVRIGVFESKYLATKSMAKNVNYDLVEIIRAETIREHFVYKDLYDI